MNYSPSAVCNNCSGNHAGMLGGARALAADVPTYHQLEHPMQLRARRVFERLYGLNKNDVRWALDGYNLLAPAAPLCNLAK